MTVDIADLSGVDVEVTPEESDSMSLATGILMDAYAGGASKAHLARAVGYLMHLMGAAGSDRHIAEGIDLARRLHTAVFGYEQEEPS